MIPRHLGRISGTGVLALKFLCVFHLCLVSRSCPNGHPWNLEAEKNSLKVRCLWHCHTRKRPREGEPDSARRCNCKLAWREGCALGKAGPDVLQPEQLVETLYWFSQQEPPGKVANWVELDRHYVYELYHEIRCALAEALAGFGCHLLGGEGRVVIVDETFVTKRRKIAGLGEWGRRTAGHKTCILAAVELDLATRKLTGNSWMRVVDRRDRATIEPILRATVRENTPIWTDQFASYDWLQSAGFPHKAVNHSKGEFVLEDGSGTNAVEGLFARAKKMMKNQNLKIPKNKDYGPYLAEFLWRQRQLNTNILPERHVCLYAFWRLVDTLRNLQFMTANKEELADAWTDLEFEAALSEMQPQIINKATGAPYPIYRQEVDTRGKDGGDSDWQLVAEAASGRRRQTSIEEAPSSFQDVPGDSWDAASGGIAGARAAAQDFQDELSSAQLAHELDPDKSEAELIQEILGEYDSVAAQDWIPPAASDVAEDVAEDVADDVAANAGKGRGRGRGRGQARGRARRPSVLQVALARGRAEEAAAARRRVQARLDALKGSPSPATPENEILELFGDFDSADEAEMFNGGV